jgi:hypothetical protein
MWSMKSETCNWTTVLDRARVGPAPPRMDTMSTFSKSHMSISTHAGDLSDVKLAVRLRIGPRVKLTHSANVNRHTN